MKRQEWFARQFRAAAGLRDVLLQSGWMHTAGGTGPYLSLRARLPELNRQHIDDLVFRRFEAVEIPTVRDSMMLVPRDDVSLALAAGRRSFEERLQKVPVPRAEIDTLAQRIMKIIGEATRSPDSLRDEIPPRYIRDLGEAGKRLGFSTTLPVALRLLQVQGRLLRLPEDFRLDARRYLFRRWPDTIPIGAPPQHLDLELYVRFATWAAPVTADDFARWAAVGKKVAKGVRIDTPPPPPVPAEGVFLLPFRDNYFALHRGLTEFARHVELLGYNNKPAPVEKLESLHHNAIVADGVLAGIWEYDAAEERIVWRTFTRTAGVEKAVQLTEAFIREQLGDHKYYAFDQGKSRETRLQFIRR